MLGRTSSPDLAVNLLARLSNVFGKGRPIKESNTLENVGETQFKKKNTIQIFFLKPVNPVAAQGFIILVYEVMCHCHVVSSDEMLN